MLQFFICTIISEGKCIKASEVSKCLDDIDRMILNFKVLHPGPDPDFMEVDRSLPLISTCLDEANLIVPSPL